MTALEFNKIMYINDRADVLWYVGRFVSERFVQNKYQIKMYAVDDFYVEVWINIDTLIIEKIKALITDHDWTGYLQSIRLSELFERK